jgi:hypothetical protein
MLADAGSRVIRAFGIFNANIPEDHPMMYGIPFPGDYLIDPDRTVRDKVFLRNYEYRPSASQIVMRQYGLRRGANSVEIKTDRLTATVSLSTDRCFPGQEIGVTLEIALKPGWHIYGEPLPQNYRSTQLVFEGPLVGEQSIALPPPRPILLKALGETLPVYDGKVRAVGKLGIRWSPPLPAKFLEALGSRIEPGPHSVAGELRFQACSDEICETPQAVKFQLPLTIEAGVPAAKASS